MHNSSREYEARVLVNGNPATEVVHDGLTYLEGRAGTSYALSFKNKTNRRVMIIPSVDGLDVITGKPCGISSSGYVVDANSTLVIPGWVVDTDTNAKFTFRRQDEVRESKMTYVEATDEGGEENQGVIGFLVFPEKKRPRPRVRRVKTFMKRSTPLRDMGMCGGESRGRGPTDADFLSQDVDYSPNDGYRGIAPTIGETYGGSEGTLSAAPCSSTVDSWGGEVEVRTSVSINTSHVAPVVDNDRSLGTGFGDPVAFHTEEVQFEAEDRQNPAAIFIFMYDTLKNLKRVGVPVEKFTKRYEKPMYEGPNPFPQSPRLTEESGCRPPAGWNRRTYRRGK